jgi:FimV-like protein
VRTCLAALLPGTIILFAGLVAAEPPPDTPGSKHTREQALKAKITVELDNEPLRKIIDELIGAVKDAKGGTIRIKPKENDGITLTSRFTVKAKDEPLEAVLDKLLKDRNWGYYVQVGPPGAQDDGAILLVSKPWRGTPEGDEKGKKDDAKMAKKETAKKEEPKKGAATNDEKTASNRLDFAENYIAGGKPEKAKPILKEIVEKYPNTKAAEEAKKLLEKLDK